MQPWRAAVPEIAAAEGKTWWQILADAGVPAVTVDPVNGLVSLTVS